LAFAVVLPVLAIDNVLFVAWLGRETPRVGLLTLPRADAEVIDYFRDQPGSLGIDSANRVLAVSIIAETPHRALFSEESITPFYRERLRAGMRLLMTGDPSLARRWGIDRLILVKPPFWTYPQWARDPKRFRVLMENEVYQVGEIVEERPITNRTNRTN
jgi:hypothetical protein